MYGSLTVGAVIPARNEEENVGDVVRDLLRVRTTGGDRVFDDIVVCDNGSADATASRAREAGARVAAEPDRGYGQACLSAISALRPVDVVVFIDGDQSFDARQSLRLLASIDTGAELAVGSRAMGSIEPGALSVPQVAGNRLASLLIRFLWRERVTDLGPFRAIRAEALRRLDMRGTAYGWTVEMQVKAIALGLKVVEIPVDTRRRRFGKSKVGGTLSGVAGASVGILSTIFRLRLRGWWEGKLRSCRRS